ncbi:MAG: alpha/beta hydrolase [Xenococcaceae cyanobacterium]
MTLRVGPFQRSVTVNDLEKFAKTGELSPDLKPYALLLTPRVRQILNKSLQIDPSLADKFLDELFRSPDGEQLIKQLSVALPGSTVEQLKAALSRAVRQANNLNVLSFFRAYPTESITVDLTSAVGIAVQLNASHLQSKILSPVLERDLKVETDGSFRPNFDPAVAGGETVRKQTLILRDRTRKRAIPADIYYSLNSHGPLVVMSHGFAADRKFLTYLAQHLASHGLTVVALEHPGSNVNSFNTVSVGMNLSKLLPASEFIDRPQDISFLLDELEKINQSKGDLQGKFNTKQVSVIGHSFGGYTALALAGAELNPKELRAFCQELSPLGRSPADWLQCAAADLPYGKIQLKDRRVASAIAFNPIVGNLFGSQLTQVSTPTLILSSSEDAITPTIEHQLRPFKQLQGEKYLLAAIGGTHMSVTDISNLNSPMGKNTLVKELMGEEAEPVRKLARGVSLAFIKQLTPEARTYQPFLTPAYVQSLSTSTLSLRLATELPVSLDVWLNVLYFGNQQIALRKSKKKRSLMSKVKEYFLSARKILPQPGYCTRQLDQIFTSLLNNYNQHSDRLS